MDKYDFSSYISCVVVDNTHSDGEDTDHFIEACHQIILVDIILKLWSTIPVSCIKPLKMESADGCALLLSVGQSSRDLMYKLLSMECMESVLPPYLHSVTNLLQVLDPDSLKSINYAKTLNRSIKLFANDVSFPVDVNRTQLLSYFVASVGEACRVFDLDEVTVSLYGENVDRLIESVVVLTVVALNCEAGSDYEDSNYLKEDWNTIKLFGVLIKLLSHHKKSVRLSLVWNILQVVGFTFGNKSEAFPVGLFGQKIFERLDLDLENCCEPFLRFICKPVFLYSLLLFCCLNDYEQKLTDDKDNESDESIQNLSVNLIEMLYSYLIAEDFEEGNWLPLLIPMKLLMWNTSSGASDRPAINKFVKDLEVSVQVVFIDSLYFT